MKNYGTITAPIMGTLMKEMVRRALLAITKERLSFDFQITEKTTDYKQDQDFLTSADIAAQKVYLDCIKEYFPGYGVIAEEENLSFPSKMPGELFFTIDPLDGTKAFIRKQSHAISTMLSLCTPTEIIAVVIGDVMTNELYYFRPEGTKIHRLHGFQTSEELRYREKPLHEQYILFREDFRNHIDPIQRLIERENSLFKSMEIEGGSIGTMFARLWKNEVGAIALPQGITTPWDANPVFGISEKMGFVMVGFKADRPIVLDFKPLTTNTSQQECIIIHSSKLYEIEHFFSK